MTRWSNELNIPWWFPTSLSSRTNPTPTDITFPIHVQRVLETGDLGIGWGENLELLVAHRFFYVQNFRTKKRCPHVFCRRYMQILFDVGECNASRPYLVCDVSFFFFCFWFKCRDCTANYSLILFQIVRRYIDVPRSLFSYYSRQKVHPGRESEHVTILRWMPVRYWVYIGDNLNPIYWSGDSG